MISDAEAKFLTIVTNTAARFDCRVANLDTDNFIVELDGPDCREQECAMALADILE